MVVRWIALGLALTSWTSARAAPSDEGLPSLEVLEATPIYARSRYYARAVDAPASVSVLTADEIRDHGYRTLGEIVGSLRGVVVYSDGSYDHLGVRGLSRGGDYNAGVSLVIDGMRINDPLFDAGLLGGEFPLDVDLIQRVEYIRGPGSAVYGGNALFGVINVVTKRGAALGGVEVAASAGTHSMRQGRVSGGWRLAEDGDLLLSASATYSGGRNLFFPGVADEAPYFGQGKDTDYERNAQFFGRYGQGPLSVMAFYGKRRRGDPLPYADGGVFNTRSNWQEDAEGGLDVAFEHDLARDHQLLLRAYAGDYRYAGNYLFHGSEPGVPEVYRYQGRASWGGVELRSTWALAGGHRIVSGGEWGWVSPVAYRAYVLDSPQPDFQLRGHRQRLGAYVQADWQLAARLVVTTGLRVDQATGFGARLSPRLGLIYKPAPATAIKVLAGRGARNPADAERIGPDDHLLSPQAERVRNLEVTLEHYLDARSRLTLAAYHYRVDDLLVGDGEGYFRNQGRIVGKGLEGEWERLWDNGLRLRASLTRSLAEGPDGRRLLASPGWIGKLNASLPLGAGWRVAWETQGVSRWYSHAGPVGGYGISNLSVLRGRQGAQGLEWGIHLGNLFDHDHADPEVTDWAAATGGRIPRPGRTVRVKASWKF